MKFLLFFLFFSHAVANTVTVVYTPVDQDSADSLFFGLSLQGTNGGEVDNPTFYLNRNQTLTLTYDNQNAVWIWFPDYSWSRLVEESQGKDVQVVVQSSTGGTKTVYLPPTQGSTNVGFTGNDQPVITAVYQVELFMYGLAAGAIIGATVLAAKMFKTGVEQGIS